MRSGSRGWDLSRGRDWERVEAILGIWVRVYVEAGVDVGEGVRAWEKYVMRE